MKQQKLEIIKKLRVIMEQNLELKNIPEQLKESHRLLEDLHIDSIMLLQLIVYMEEVFQIVVPEVGIDPETFLTVGSLFELIIDLQHTAV